MQMSRVSMRRRGVIAVAGVSVSAALFALPAAQAEPEVTSKDVEAAFHDAEAINEQVNQLGVEVEQTQDEIADLTIDIKRHLRVYRAQKQQLGDAIVQQQLDAPLGTTASLLGSSNPEEFLEGLGAVQALNNSRADSLSEFETSSKELKNRRAQLEDRKESLEEAKDDAAAKRSQIRKKYQAAKAKLARLNALERKKLNTSDVKLDFDPSASGRAKAAIDFALAQLGEPYVYGGAGPSSWDCSGLVMKAFAAAGVSLPRVVSPQMSAGTSVPFDQIKPGDLVAYSSMSHIGIYLGNGKVVHAPRPGKSVEITSLSGFTRAARVG